MTVQHQGDRLDALFLSPHPDDVELFCGGTVARLVEMGKRVAIVDLTAGERASNGTVEQRRAESLVAARTLGLETPRLVLGLPDAGLDEKDPGQLKRVLELLRATRPRALFAPHPQDRHPDHVAAGKLAREAFAVDEELGEAGAKGADGPRPLVGALYEYPCHFRIDPQIFVDVSQQMERRRDTLAAYQSQFVRGEGQVETPINEPGFLAANEARLRDWGVQAGVEFAEGFLLAAARGAEPLANWTGEKRG